MKAEDIKIQSLKSYPPVYGKDAADVFAQMRTAWMEGAQWVLDKLMGESFRAQVATVIDSKSRKRLHIAKLVADFGTLQVPVQEGTDVRIIIVSEE